MWQIGHFLKKPPFPKLLTYIFLILSHFWVRKSWEIQPDIFFCLEYQMERRDLIFMTTIGLGPWKLPSWLLSGNFKTTSFPEAPLSFTMSIEGVSSCSFLTWLMISSMLWSSSNDSAWPANIPLRRSSLMKTSSLWSSWGIVSRPRTPSSLIWKLNIYLHSNLVILQFADEIHHYVLISPFI